MRIARVFVLSLVLVTIGCSKDPPPKAEAANTTAAQTTPASALPISADAPTAAVGQPAPDFTLTDLDGKATRLSSFKGKVVVLEWFNPGCPFVKASHSVGSLKEAAKKHTKNGVVWLAINSGAAGKEGASASANHDGAARFGMTHPVLLDPTGAVGRKYGATNTPHMYVIDERGLLAYRGAIDNSPDGEGQSAPDGKLVSYVDEAVAAVTAGKPVSTAETKAYGCSVKYGKAVE